MFRELIKYKSRFLSVFFMALVSMIIFGGMGGVWNGLIKEVDDFAQKGNLADQWVYTMGMSQENMDDIKALDGVRDVTFLKANKLFLDEGEGEIRVYHPDNEKVFKPMVMEGEPYDSRAKGLWLDQEFAKEHDISVGDKVNGQWEVKGIILSPEFISYKGANGELLPNYEKYGYGVCGEDISGLWPVTEARLDTEKDISSDVLRDTLGDTYMGSVLREDFTPYSEAEGESKQIRKMSLLFSSVFLLLALLTMYTSMVRLVNGQLIEVGTMKALGIKRHKILLHYALYGVFPPLLGGIIGLIVGTLTISKAIMNLKKLVLVLPNYTIETPPIAYGVIILMSLACLVAAMWAVSRATKGMPAQTMRGILAENERVPKGSKSEKEKEQSSARVPYFWKWVLRSIARNKARFAMGVVGVAGGLLLIIAGIGLRDSINYSDDYVYDKQFNYDVRATLAVPGEVPDWDYPTEELMETTGTIHKNKSGDRDEQVIVTITDQGDMLRFYDLDGKKMKLPDDGVVIAQSKAEELDIEEGDEFYLRPRGSSEDVKVSVAKIGKVLTPLGVSMSKVYYESLGQSFVSTTLLIDDAREKDVADDPQIYSAVSEKRQKNDMKELSESVMTIVRLLILASVFLSVVILYNLGILSFGERIREYATMKVLGFYDKELRGIAIRECLLSTLIGWIIGIPIGINFLHLYVRTVTLDNYSWVPHVSAFNMIVASLVIIGISFGVSMILSRKVRKISMVEALKSVE